MKVLIWLGLGLLYIVIVTEARMSGNTLGAVPSMLLFALWITASRALSKAYENYKYDRDAEKAEKAREEKEMEEKAREEREREESRMD